MRLRRDDVIDAAMALLDEVGLDDLTTRRLADRLGVRVGALYWHVKDKRELLCALADRIVAGAAPPEFESDGYPDWERPLVDGAHLLRAAMLRHPDGARLVAGYAPAALGTLRAAEAGLKSMIDHGVPLATAAYAGDAVMSYVTGFVLQEQSTGPASDVDFTELPTLARWMAERPATKDVAFAAGLGFIVDGIRIAIGTS